MLIFNNRVDLIAFLKPFIVAKSAIGFVPTMGALHRGHLSLLKESINNNKVTIISIFVNPTQFNNQEDLAKYPRTLNEDVAKIETISDTIVIYAPTIEDIYIGKTVSQHFDFDGLENQMEGKFRPGHFDGVGTVVKRLFEIVIPTNAYFGEKDFQQLQIIRKLVEINNLPVIIVECPIFREQNGLAMSSRNERLTIQEREKAAIIHKTLEIVKAKFKNKSANKISNFVVSTFKKHPEFELEYFEIADEKTLLKCFRKNKKNKYRAFIAVFVNNIRLIDTVSLN